MNSNWKICKIGNLVDIKRGSSPRPIHKYLSKVGMPWVKIADATSDKSRYLTKTNQYIIDDGINKSVVVEPETLIVSNSATPGLPKILKIQACVHDGWLVFSDYKGILRDFLYYKFIDIHKNLINQANGSVFQNLKIDIVKDFNIYIPPLETQQKIVKILSAIDDKIELNNKINENLEQQAQAIFKSWFVDFEPFGGTMPEDWKEKTLDEFCNIFTGRKNANEFDENGENKFFTCGPVPLKINSYIYNGQAVIISGNGAYTGRTRFYDGKFDLYQRTYACTMLKDVKKDYIYLLYFIIKNVLQKNIAGGTHGSAIPYIVLNDIAKFKLNFSQQVFDKLSLIMKSIMNKILYNYNENEYLTQLRDTLLPKLMSGEINVENIEG